MERISGWLLIVGLWALAYFRVPWLGWGLSLGAALGGYHYYLGLAYPWLVWSLFLGLFLPLSIPWLRQHGITQMVLSKVQRRMPEMSQTEKEAIASGDVWWEGDLFQGQTRWKSWLAQPPTQLTQTEQAFLDHQVEQLMQYLDDWKIVHETHDLPENVWTYLRQEKFFGLVIPKAYGGLGFSALAHSMIITRLASSSISAAVTAMVPNSLGPAELLLQYGTQQQKDYYLPRLAQGIEIPCFGLTAPEAGSDAGAITDSGEIVKGDYHGKEILGIKLNWNKRYITLAPVATLLGLAFKLKDPQGFLKGPVELGITLCLIPTNTPGVEVGMRHFPLEMAFMNGPTRGQDVFIPLDWIIGGRKQAGQGWRMLMECLATGRGISLPALSTATCMLSARTSGAYARVRTQFKTPIGYFEGIQEKLARIGGFTYIVEATRQLTLSAIDDGVKPVIVSAIAKYHMTEMARQAVNDAMDIHAGKGIILGPHNYLGRAYQAIPISITVEGANILTRNLIIFGQGAIRCHPFLQAEIQAISDARAQLPGALSAFDRAFWGHVKYFISNFAKATWQGLLAGRGLRIGRQTPLKFWLRRISWRSISYAFLADLLLIMLGGKLKKAERLSSRLGDILSYLYLSTAVIKYFEQHNGSPSATKLPNSERQFAQWALTHLNFEIEVAFKGLLMNFPLKGWGPILQFLLFPWGLKAKPPSDKLSSQVAMGLMQPSEFRERLTHSCQSAALPESAIQITEHAFQSVFAVQPILKKLREATKAGQIVATGTFMQQVKQAVAAKVITDEQGKMAYEYELARTKAIAVDEFTFDYFLGKHQKWKPTN